MGITGLLPFLENASKKTHVAEFRGCTAAIDAYCWLHRGAFGCAEKLVRGEETNGYVLYCMKYIKMLQSYNIRPILVFDGQHLPAKKQTETKRREQRAACRKKAAEYLRLGKSNEARNYMRQCIDITHKMALALIKECRANGIDCIVAPYEADAQLAFLNIQKMAHFVITEDSDLLLFGCNKIFFKMDLQGCGTLVEADKINNCMKLRNDTYSFDKFRYMCILSGCDYLENLPGIGLKKALKFITLTVDPNIYNVLAKLPSYLKLTNIVMTNEYREAFMVADATFKHQLVYDPLQRKLIPLNDPSSCGTKLEYCKNAGDMFASRTAFQLALGNIDPFTHEIYDDWSPDSITLHDSSIWAASYRKPTEEPQKKPKLKAPDTIGKKVVVNVTNEEEIEYDVKLQEELDQYKRVQQPLKRQKIESERPLSPVLSNANIPFKKLSKFPRTKIDYDSIVVSRFFSSKVSTKDEGHSNTLLTSIDEFAKQRKSLETIEAEDNVNEKLGAGHQESGKIKKDGSDSSTKTKIDNDSIDEFAKQRKSLETTESEDNLNEKLGAGHQESTENDGSGSSTISFKDKFHFKKRKCVAQIVPPDLLQEIENETESLKTVHIEEQVTENNKNVENLCNTNNEECIESAQLQEKAALSNSQPRTKQLPCRRLGLPRIKNKSQPKKQPTILSLFDNMKKK